VTQLAVLPGTFTVARSVELAVLTRSGFIESRHAGSAVVVDAIGHDLLVLGDADSPVFPRSCLKPFQAMAVLESGVRLSSVQTALSTASHSGTPEHLAVVRSILATVDLGESQLGCPADWPGSRSSRDAVVRAGGHPEAVMMNCSGKHAAMLVACHENGWSTVDYLDPSHPLQEKVLEVVERYTGEKVAFSGIDGCGAPVHAVSLRGLARGISKIAQGLDDNSAWLVASVLENGWALDGPGEENTIVIERLGVFAKIGAEGVMVMSTTAGVSVALKILDGNLRAAVIVALELLVRVGALTRSAVDDTLTVLNLKVLGGGKPVGSIQVTA
jgi:L-asparaginase II